MNYYLGSREEFNGRVGGRQQLPSFRAHHALLCAQCATGRQSVGCGSRAYVCRVKKQGGSPVSLLVFQESSTHAWRLRRRTQTSIAPASSATVTTYVVGTSVNKQKLNLHIAKNLGLTTGTLG